MAIRGYFLGCPVWARREWVGHALAAGTRATDLLEAYAHVFNAVEGNTTFYAVPEPDVVARWRDQTPETFRFCFKFPRTITHDRRLRSAGALANAFVGRVAPLGPRLGPIMVQLPASFGPEDLPVLEDFLVALPAGPTYAVEARHAAFVHGTAADELDAVLAELAVDRVVLDTRGLHRARGEDPVLVQAQGKKPALPVRATTPARRPIVRLCAGPQFDLDADILDEWALRLVQWIAAGLRPHVFAHLPDDLRAPELAGALHDRVAAQADVGTIGWPRAPSEQIDLF